MFFESKWKSFFSEFLLNKTKASKYCATLIWASSKCSMQIKICVGCINLKIVNWIWAVPKWVFLCAKRTNYNLFCLTFICRWLINLSRVKCIVGLCPQPNETISKCHLQHWECICAYIQILTCRVRIWTDWDSVDLHLRCYAGVTFQQKLQSSRSRTKRYPIKHAKHTYEACTWGFIETRERVYLRM